MLFNVRYSKLPLILKLKLEILSFWNLKLYLDMIKLVKFCEWKFKNPKLASFWVLGNI